MSDSAIATIAAAMITGIFGTVITQELNEGFKERALIQKDREIEISVIKAVNDLAKSVVGSDEKQHVMLISLSSYEKYGVPHLYQHILSLDNKPGLRRTAEKSLLFIAAKKENTDTVVNAMSSILKDKVQQFSWEAHLSALRVLWRINTTESLNAIVSAISDEQQFDTLAKVYDTIGVGALKCYYRVATKPNESPKLQECLSDGFKARERVQ